MGELFENRRIIIHRALTARFGSQFDIDRLHVRAVHGTWGIAEGFDASLLPGETLLEISPGFGYDTDGTPIELTDKATVAPYRTGNYDIVVTEDGVFAVPSPRADWCPGSLVVATARAVATSTTSLGWTDLRLPTRWTRPRESAYLRAGSQTFSSATFGTRLDVSTAAARFPRTPLYFCQLDTPRTDFTMPSTPLGVHGVAGQNRYTAGSAPIHGPFFTICSATDVSFTVLFTRSVAGSFPTLTVHWVGVIPRSQVFDLSDPCKTYPTPIIIN